MVLVGRKMENSEKREVAWAHFHSEGILKTLPGAPISELAMQMIVRNLLQHGYTWLRGAF